MISILILFILLRTLRTNKNWIKWYKNNIIHIKIYKKNINWCALEWWTQYWCVNWWLHSTYDLCHAFVCTTSVISCSLYIVWLVLWCLGYWFLLFLLLLSCWGNCWLLITYRLSLINNAAYRLSISLINKQFW